ncbi:hypothetical protein MFIFM68171_00032 [Madurella fahalii]|uniref:SnoaL-like polyketide cyclase n=1 Tax=Madurella fahalii TaxID=1157608 RepID=A0ABQ0FWE9_9PEZI
MDLFQPTARFATTGVTPPPKVDNRRRFKNFIERINRRQWEFLSDAIHARLSYNKHDMSLYEFSRLLKQEFAPKANITMDLVTAVGGGDDHDGPVAARLRVKILVTEAPYIASAARQQLEYARHIFAHFADNKISAIYDISEEDHKQTLSQGILPLPSLRPPPPRISINLRQFYTDYIACINSGKMAQELHRFCRPSGVVWNGTRLTIQQYGDMMQDSIDAISGLHFHVHTLVVEESRQQLAARIEFTGTPVKPHAGGIPNGRAVFFAEHVFYWLEQGKISDVLSIVDWEDYRAQLAR